VNDGLLNSDVGGNRGDVRHGVYLCSCVAGNEMTDKLRAAAQAVLKNAKSLFLGCGDFNHLKKDFHDDGKCPPLQRYNEALAALKTALAEPNDYERGFDDGFILRKEKDGKRPWVGLTDEEILEMFGVVGTSGSDINPRGLLKDTRRIEAKLREKNT
jgi:hypothetical protein